MKELKIIDLYQKTNEQKLNSFSETLNSSVEVSHVYSDYIYDDEKDEKGNTRKERKSRPGKVPK